MQLVHFESFVGVVCYQMQLAEYQVVQALFVALGPDFVPMHGAIFENIVELQVLCGATQVPERFVHFHLSFHELFFSNVREISSTQILELGLPDE